MGIKERREREKQVTRQAILDAAQHIAQAEGWSAVTIRRVGEHIEYSAPMVYQYFTNKEDMLIALLQEGFQRLEAAMRHASASTPEPEERLLRIADAYWQFAQSNRDLYQLMHGLAGIPVNTQVIANAIQQVCFVAEDALTAWTQANGVICKDAYEAVELLWGILHGLISLAMLHRLTGNEARISHLIHQAVSHQLAGWRISQTIT